jgi:hypothetical protein
MPVMPNEHKPLPNGLATLISTEVITKDSKFGEQEEVTCVVEFPEGYPPQRVWISHKSFKQVKSALACGLAEQDGNNWEVKIGVRFSAVVENGKFVNLLPAQNAPNTQVNEE